jgi:hypothetical protein
MEITHPLIHSSQNLPGIIPMMLQVYHHRLSLHKLVGKASGGGTNKSTPHTPFPPNVQSASITAGKQH